MKIHYFSIGLVITGILFVTNSQEYAFSLPKPTSDEYYISLINGDVPFESCRCVAFRLDDFTDTWLDKVKIQLVDTFYQKNASLLYKQERLFFLFSYSPYPRIQY